MGPSSSTFSPQPQVVLARELFESYATYQIPGITSRRFSQAEMLRWLEPLKSQNLFTSTPLGKSSEGRTISLLKLGKGNIKVLLWSQMHGDESTATMALLDILNFFAQQPQHNVTRTILNGLSLLIIPMLNPDGAERFQRRTAQVIDMNRDAMALRTPEARILKETRGAYKPEFGFNLHDQDPRYTVGNSKRVSAVALLTPAYDETRGDNDVRRAAKQVASVFLSVLDEFIHGHVSKYDDTFEPRAFGDNIQKWGTSTVLVESGGWPGDRDKMFIRKLNYVGLLTSLHAIATGSYRQADLSAYDRLPFGTKYLYDVILRNAEWRGNATVPAMRADIGINLDEETNPETGRVELVGKVVDIGDLSVYSAFRDVDASEHSLNGDEMKIDQRIPIQRIDFFLKKR
jgi:hypothetical protein